MILDLRGKLCPIPVITAKRTLADSEVGEVTLLVDNFIAVQNLEKMAKGLQFDFAFEEIEVDHFEVTISKTEIAKLDVKPQLNMPDESISGSVVLINKQNFGSGDDELGAILMKGFIFALTEVDVPPSAICFVNGGIHFACKNSSVLGDLLTLKEKGVELLVCGACLNFYEKAEELEVGEVCNMFTIANLLTSKRAVTI